MNKGRDLSVLLLDRLDRRLREFVDKWKQSPPGMLEEIMFWLDFYFKLFSELRIPEDRREAVIRTFADLRERYPAARTIFDAFKDRYTANTAPGDRPLYSEAILLLKNLQEAIENYLGQPQESSPRVIFEILDLLRSISLPEEIFPAVMNALHALGAKYRGFAPFLSLVVNDLHPHKKDP
jgi:hypothetical protein